MCNIRQAVIRAMHDKDMTLHDLAEASGVTYATLHRWMSPQVKGESHTTTATLSLVMRALGLTIGYIPGARPARQVLGKSQ